MSKITSFVLTALITLSIFPSCRKVCDFIRDHPDAHDSVCHITKLIFGDIDPSRPWDIVQLGVTYNAKGNPVSLTEINPGKPYFSVELYFRYDRFDRLSDFQYTVAVGGGYDDPAHPGDPLIWHKYAYPHPNMISDTVLTYTTGPLNGPSPIAPPGVPINLYKFNAAGKMIAVAETVNLPNQPAPVFATIPYDARGNRDRSAFTNLRYDSAVNVYRTNKVWQLVFLDYSRNNPVYTISPSTPTNQFGLPTRLPYVTRGDVTNFLWYSYPISYYYIEYACSAPKGPVDY